MDTRYTVTAATVTRYAVAPYDGTAVKAARPSRGSRGRRSARPLIEWFNRGGDGADRWVWGQPGDLTACHAVASRHMSSERAWGFCQRRHHDALGTYNKPDGKATGDLVYIAAAGLGFGRGPFDGPFNAPMALRRVELEQLRDRIRRRA